MRARRSGVPELDRLAAGVLCVGFDGATPGAAPLERLAQLGPGGVVIFARNVHSVEKTNVLLNAVRDAIESKTGRAPFVAVDQEGGRVSRLRAGAHDIPSMMAVGATRDAGLAERVGALLGADQRAAGIDVDFAPVMDLALGPSGTAIGDRAFGDDPDLVAELGTAVVRGLQSQGIVATLKHFPGHGSTGVDSHVRLPVVEADAATLRARDLIPFAHGIENGARAVMSAHVVFKAFDPEQPATLSSNILTAVLRGELGFDGVCFTDCLEMDAIAQTAGTPQAAARAIAAGADCAVISHSLNLAERARDAIVAAVRAGTLSQTRLEQAFGRIATLRRGRHGAWPPVDPNAGAEAARRAVTVVRAQRPGGVLVKEPVTVVSFEGSTTDGARGTQSDYPSLSLALRERHVRSESMRVPLEPSSEALEQLVSILRAQGGRDVVLLSRRAHVHAAQREALDALLAVARDAVFVSMREPFDAALFPQARTVLCTYGDGEAAVAGLADVLTGRAVAEGRLPVQLAAASCL